MKNKKVIVFILIIVICCVSASCATASSVEVPSDFSFECFIVKGWGTGSEVILSTNLTKKQNREVFIGLERICYMENDFNANLFVHDGTHVNMKVSYNGKTKTIEYYYGDEDFNEVHEIIGMALLFQQSN